MKYAKARQILEESGIDTWHNMKKKDVYSLMRALNYVYSLGDKTWKRVPEPQMFMRFPSPIDYVDMHQGRPADHLDHPLGGAA